MLFEPEEDSLTARQWDTGPGLLEVQDPTRPYVTIPISNNTNHDITIPRKNALGVLQPVENVVEGDKPDVPKSSAAVSEVTTSQNNSTDPPLRHPPVNLDHLEEEQ